MDEWFISQSGQSERKLITRTHLALDVATGAIVGYYSTLACSIAPNDSSGLGQHFNIKYPISAVLIARLAVDLKYHNAGIGGRLLAHALHSAVSVNQITGLQAVIVDALDLEAAAYYGKHGFITFIDNPLRLYLPMKTIIASMD